MSTTFSPPVTPSVGGVQTVTTPRVGEVKLGDGYSQRARDGLNWLGRKVTLRWDVLSAADANTIVGFFETQGGDLHFLYAVPPSATTRKWVARSWDRTYDTALTHAVTAELEEVFDL